MAGRGPAPKPAGRRARRNQDLVPTRSVRLVRAPAPELPALFDKDGSEVEWHIRTQDWWRIWAESPLADDLTAVDWQFLLDTAYMHHAMWTKGRWEFASEIRLRVAKFGATPEDRARLRIVFESADEAEDRGRARRERQGVQQPTRGDDPRRALRAVE